MPGRARSFLRRLFGTITLALLMSSCVVLTGKPSGSLEIVIGLFNPAPGRYVVDVVQYNDVQYSTAFTNGFATVRIPSLRHCTTIVAFVPVYSCSQEKDSFLRISKEGAPIWCVRLDKVIRSPRDGLGRYMIRID
jgi:hypothetical protein